MDSYDFKLFFLQNIFKDDGMLKKDRKLIKRLNSPM
jgi:hypothetical protein